MSPLFIAISVVLVLQIRTCLGEPPGFAAYHNFDFPVVENVNPYYQKSPADDREANSTQFSCKSSGYFADSNDCSRFYECIFSFSGYSQLNYTCPEGTMYLETDRKCVADERDSC